MKKLFTILTLVLVVFTVDAQKPRKKVAQRSTRTTQRVNQKAYLSCPDNNHPHMIDLGLVSGKKWACCNVGAGGPTGTGNYYAWGETMAKMDYSIYTYKCSDGTRASCHFLGNDIAGTCYDVAHVKWGGIMDDNIYKTNH